MQVQRLAGFTSQPCSFRLRGCGERTYATVSVPSSVKDGSGCAVRLWQVMDGRKELRRVGSTWPGLQLRVLSCTSNTGNAPKASLLLWWHHSAYRALTPSHQPPGHPSWAAAHHPAPRPGGSEQLCDNHSQDHSGLPWTARARTCDFLTSPPLYRIAGTPSTKRAQQMWENYWLNAELPAHRSWWVLATQDCTGVKLWRGWRAGGRIIKTQEMRGKHDPEKQKE